MTTTRRMSMIASVLSMALVAGSFSTMPEPDR